MGCLSDVPCDWRYLRAPTLVVLVRSCQSSHLALGLVAYVRVLRSYDPQLRFCGPERSGCGNSTQLHFLKQMHKPDRRCGGGYDDLLATKRLWHKLPAEYQSGPGRWLVFLDGPGVRPRRGLSAQSQSAVHECDGSQLELRRGMQSGQCVLCNGPGLETSA